MSNSNSSFPLTHFFISVIFSLLLIFFSARGRLHWLTSPVTNIFTPLRLPFVNLNRSITANTSLIREIPNQQRLIKDLQRQNAALSVIAQKNDQLEAENLALKNIIHSPISVDHRLLPVRVVGVSRFAYVDHGSNDGLKPGLPVVIDNILLGLIDSVSANSARVKLLTDTSLSLNVTTSLGSTGTLNFVSDHLEIKEVLQKQPLQVDDRVFTSGSELVQSGLLIGVITEIKSAPSNIYQTAILKSSAALADQQVLFVILD